MPFTVRNDAQDVLFHMEEDLDKAYFTSPQMHEQVHQLDYSFGRARFQETTFDGFIIGYGNMQVFQRLHVESHEQLQNVGIHFMLQGSITSSIAGLNNTVTTASQQYNMSYNPDMREHMLVEKQPDISVFALAFTCDRFMELAANNGPVLNRCAEKVEQKKPVFFDKGFYITPRMMKVIEEVRTCHFTGGLKKLFLQSKAIELLALQCEQIEEDERGRQNVSRITRTDEEKIHHARDLLIAQSQEPPSLHELARLAGLNEFKLKSGFRKVFDNTVFGYLSDYRLEQARHMVREGERSFTDIADELGYSSVQHFSSAFRKKFGVSPSHLK